MSEISSPQVAGLEPWLPWPLRAWPWFTRPVRAERLAVLRIGIAACLLADLLTSYRPHIDDFFAVGPENGSSSAAHGFDWSLPWRLVACYPPFLHGAFWIWVAAAALLLVGWQTRLAALACWVLSLSFASANPRIDNAGDTLRNTVLFYLMLCPCGAAWSVDQALARRRHGAPRSLYVWPWALRLLFIQLVITYFMSGLYKATGMNWRAGFAVYYVLADLTLTRFSLAELPVPLAITRVATWLVLFWELTFPLLVLWRPTRRLALGFGVAFHLCVLALLELGGFSAYVLCLYLPLLPWLGENTSPLREQGSRRTLAGAAG